MIRFIYRLTRRGIEVTSEVICEAHHRTAHDMVPLSPHEKKRGYEQTLRPYSGERPCATCEEEQGRPQRGVPA